MRLKDKVALITGGGRGIGRAICLRLAEEGADVAILELDPETGRETAQAVESLGRKSLALRTDITVKDQVDAAVSKVADKYGKIDVLVNNVGWDKQALFVNTTEELWEKVIAVNLKGHIYCTHAVLGGMIERQCGKIIYISSDAGRVGNPGEAIYSACKGGIIAFAKALARELARHKINVNVVCPGPTDTPLFYEIGEGTERAKKATDALIKATPLRRIGQPEDIAAAVSYLASSDSDFVTGQSLSVSGGLTMI
jgi:2-hydroxycyclohexanecarboxyl-CoA dehydrogenase